VPGSFVETHVKLAKEDTVGLVFDLRRSLVRGRSVCIANSVLRTKSHELITPSLDIALVYFHDISQVCSFGSCEDHSSLNSSSVSGL
jgi:hypothetical protein